MNNKIFNFMGEPTFETKPKTTEETMAELKQQADVLHAEGKHQEGEYLMKKASELWAKEREQK